MSQRQSRPHRAGPLCRSRPRDRRGRRTKRRGERSRTRRFPRANLDALAEAGWNGALTEPRHGGLGLNHVDFAEAAYRIGKADASTGLVYVMHVGAAQTINLFGNDDQKDRWLKPNGRHLLGTYSTSERAPAATGGTISRRPRRDGEDYIVNAEKSFTTSSGQADYYVMQTRTPDAKDQTDIIFFIIDGKAPGIEAGPWDALGVRANHSGPIRYKGVKVPAARPARRTRARARRSSMTASRRST